MTIGERIKERRLKLGLTADAVAEALNKNRATVYRYESNDIEKLPTTVLEPLAKALQTTPAYLMGWEDETEKKNDNTTSEPDELSQKEKQLILDFRSLNSQGQELILQQMFMAKEVYKKDTDVSDVEIVG